MVHSSMNCMGSRQSTVDGGELGGGRGGLDADAAAAGALRLEGRELDHAVDERKDGEVAAEADAVTRVDHGALLADQDVAGAHHLAVEALDAAHLRVGVAAVSRGALSFFVSHVLVLRVDAGDLDRGEGLAVTGLP